MKKLKITVSSILLMAMVFALSSCKTNTDEKIKVATLKGATGIGMVKLMDNDSYDVSIASSPDEIVSYLTGGSVDIAACPLNLAAALYKKTNGGIRMLAVNTLGVLYILENGNTINSISDLKGKTIYATGQGSTPEYILNYLLTENGIDTENDVTIEYKAEHSELATLAASGEVTICMLPEPNVTTVLSKNSNLRIALNLTEEWEKVCKEKGIDGTLAQGCIVATAEFVNNNEKEVKAFLKEYEKSVNYVNENVADASLLVAESGIIEKATIAEKAIPNCNITYIDGAEMKSIATQNLEILYNANAKAVGGQMPDENFYFSAEK